MPINLLKLEVKRWRESPKFYSFNYKKYHKSRSLTSRFSHNFHPNRRRNNSRLCTPLPSTDRPPWKRTFYTTDFTCRSEASTGHKNSTAITRKTSAEDLIAPDAARTSAFSWELTQHRNTANFVRQTTVLRQLQKNGNFSDISYVGTEGVK